MIDKFETLYPDFLTATDLWHNEDDTITENNSLKEEVISYFQGYWPGTETAEQCNTDMHFTPLAIMRLAEHFAKWGAEHLKK